MSKMLELLTIQFGNPTGFLGRLVGWSMRYKNRSRVWAAVDTLHVQPADNVLELGCGPGVAVHRIADTLLGEGGHIDAIDHSALMVDMAQRYNKQYIANGKVAIAKSTVAAWQYKAEQYDIIFAINVHLFWGDVPTELRQLKQLLYEEGKLHLFFQPHWIKEEAQLQQEALKMYNSMEQAGYKEVVLEYIKMKPVDCIHVQGTLNNK